MDEPDTPSCHLSGPPGVSLLMLDELLHTSNKAVPDTQSLEDLANDFGRVFVGRMTTICNEVDSQSINSSLSTTTYIQSSPVTCLFSDFQLMTNEELLSVIKKCPNKSCAPDPMPTWLVKQHIDTLLQSINQSINVTYKAPKSFSYIGWVQICCKRYKI